MAPPDEPADVTNLIEAGRDREAAERGASLPVTPDVSRGAWRNDTRHDPKGTHMSTTLTLDALAAVKTKQQATWASGDYAVIGTSLQIIGEQLCEAVDVSAGWTVLDVAAGNGNASLAAARRGCNVTATDYVEALLDGARRRADADLLHIDTKVADAEDLPFADESFDAVLSTVGVMFTPNPERAAGELVRVVRRGGRIGLANWTLEGFVGQMFKIVGQHVPPPEGVPSPLRWGTDAGLQALLGSECELDITRRTFAFRFRSAEDYFETFREFYGPLVKAWAALDEMGRKSLRDQLVELADAYNRNVDGALTVDSEYVEVVATRH